jgi:acyl-coenzyme A synthetase/AMP-(fatty) acid ligase
MALYIDPDRVREISKKLKTGKVYSIQSTDVVEHASAYAAYREVGGRVMVLPPHLTNEYKQFVQEYVDDESQYGTSGVIVMTSGTTGNPKIVIHNLDSFQSCDIMISEWGIDEHTNVIATPPPFTSFFWALMHASYNLNGCSRAIHATRDTLVDIVEESRGSKFIMLASPGLLDLLEASSTHIDFSGMERMMMGGSKMLDRHVDIAFSRGVNKIVYQYASTEIIGGLYSYIHKDTPREHYETLSESSMGKTIRIVDGLLMVKGIGLAKNLHLDDQGYYNTGDMFNVESDGRYRFLGRVDDMIKLNGLKCFLTKIEEECERIGLINTLAVPRQRMGVEYIELQYTDSTRTIDILSLKRELKDLLLDQEIPRAYTKVDSIKKTPLGKKIRRL